MAHGAFIDRGGKQALLEGSAAFVGELLQQRTAAAAAGGAAGSLQGTLAAACVAAAVIGTAVGIGVAGIVKARSQ